MLNTQLSLRYVHTTSINQWILTSSPSHGHRDYLSNKALNFRYSCYERVLMTGGSSDNDKGKNASVHRIQEQ